MASKSTSAILTTTLLLFHTHPFSSTACSKEEFQALVAFKEAFPPKTFPKWWGASADCCSWGNITSCKNGRVTSLRITNYLFDRDVAHLELHGSLPPSLGDLSALTNISIYFQPNLHGPIPYSWSKLKKLESITIYSSNISGPIPSFLSQLTSLQELQLEFNELTGAIPPSLGNLVSLKKLSFRQNKLTGTIPPSLGNLVSLYSVSFMDNKLTGTIPSTLFSRHKKGLVAEIDLTLNQLTGAIPKSFGSVPFSHISLGDNKLSGDASFLFGKSKPLVQMTLSTNKLSFDLTNVEYPVKNLQILDLSNNEIYGSINEQITQVLHEISLDVTSNKLCGKIPRGGKFTPMYASSFIGNKCLCGNPLPACK